MSAPSACGCTLCPNGAPYQWRVSISGTTNNVCTDCSHANGDFTLNYVSGCAWQLAVTGICAGSATLKLFFTQNAGGGVDMTVELDSRGGRNAMEGHDRRGLLQGPNTFARWLWYDRLRLAPDRLG